MIHYRVALVSLIDNNDHLVSANSHILFTSEKTYYPRLEGFITKINQAVLNKTKIKFSSCNKNILHCHF